MLTLEGVSKSPCKLWFHTDLVVSDHLQVPGLAHGPVQKEPWAEEAPSRESQLKYVPQKTQPFPEREDNPESRDKGSLLQPLITEVESQVFSEKLTSSTSTFEATSEVEGTLEQQQRNPKLERLRQSPAQWKHCRQVIVTHKKTPAGKEDHKCSECGEVFIYNSCLRIHQRIHSRKKTL